jgi:hypothetical protein
MHLSVPAGLLLALGSQARAAEGALDSAYPVDWRGVPLRAVLDEWSRNVNVPYMLDSAVSPEAADRRIRLYAEHLTGRQVLRWAARLAGLEAVFREGVVLVAPPQKLPRLWRLTDGRAVGGPSQEQWLHDLAQRRPSITWIDAPLSTVGRAISSDFGIDVVFHPDVLSDGGLVHLESAETSLDAVRAALEDQLKTRTFVDDGALWVVPASQRVDEPTSRPGDTSPMPLPGAWPAAAAGPLDQFVVLDRSVANWRDLCDRLSRAAGVICRVKSPGTAFGAPFEARGTVGEVLEAARLLGRLGWRLLPGEDPGGASLELRPGGHGG